MRQILLFYFFIIFWNGFSQKTIPEVLKQFNNNSVPYISVAALKLKENILIFDARELKEFNVSHLKNAQYVGFDKFSSKKIRTLFKNQNTTIVVYCSIGVRSEKIGEKLIKLGYKNVFNLFGGIFEWKNMGEEVYDNDEKITQNIHTFSKEWNQYALKGNKIY